MRVAWATRSALAARRLVSSSSAYVVGDKFGCATVQLKAERLPELGAHSPPVHHNLGYDAIFDLEQGEECRLTAQGAMAVDTGAFTGRSPKDKYVVDEASSRHKVWWGEVNQPMPETVFNELHDKVLEHLAGKRELFVFDGFAGANPKSTLKLRVVAAKAWQHHFCRNMFIRPKKPVAPIAAFEPQFTIYCASDFTNDAWQRHGLNSDAFVAFHLGRRVAIIGGTSYAGEMKKGIFSVMNYFKPLDNVLTMHCSANVGKHKGDVALFFGTSGTGKTTLSTDPERPIVGDDEHGWGDDGIFNIEGGCYAKVINLSPEDEPLIYGAIKRNALLENVDIRDEDGTVDYRSARKTANTRVSYPITHIPNRVHKSVAGHPNRILFLACDVFGVLPPVSKLTSDQAMYHFLSGFSAKIAGTERGVKQPVPTFSACFGSAFLTLPPTTYAKMLGDKMRQHQCQAYLVNTGWAGGNPDQGGKRMPIATTRALVNAIFNDALDHDAYTHHPVLNLHVPDAVLLPDGTRDENFDHTLLHPWEAWTNREDYEDAANNLARLFVDNFKQFTSSSKDATFDFSAHGPQPRGN
ncbi:hypothetical protein CTAYLR_009468 [Chrysophaeum taylorii]|uniref:phosphoenolpyruvate carboxykinase (ATP) n=1 Tax=Chrysophaeum taylorii TaxID=2483200 RepID=A0AAD7U634_9STRA|nr:hypothetical protein CTAYLR_009468 [Chrysophaeum taylorii]